MSKPTFAERCLLAEQCLPDAPYRAMLTQLHAEMLAALSEQPAQLPFGVGGGLVAIKMLLSRDPCVHANTAIQMIDAILAEQLAQQKPVAWMHVMDNTEGIKANGKGYVSITQKRKHPFGKPGIDFSKSYPVTSTPLYTSPPAQRTWVGLTDEERDDLLGNYITAEGRARAIEAKLKEKNT